MPRSHINSTAACLVLPALAACGSQSDVTPATGVAPPPPPVIERDAFVIPNTATAAAPFPTADFATGSITILGGTRANPEAVTIRIAGREYRFDEAAGDTVNPGGVFVFFRDEGAARLTQGFIDTRGTSVVYGRLRQDPGSVTASDGFLGIVADGPQTLDMPVGGSATFSGKAIGYAVVSRRGGDEIRGTNADVDIAVNFASGAVDLRTSRTIYNAGAGNVIEPDYDVSGSGTLDGATYRGALDTTRRGDLRGEFRGEFFGDAAEETGGIIVFQDGGTTYGAAFGASQVPTRID